MTRHPDLLGSKDSLDNISRSLLQVSLKVAFLFIIPLSSSKKEFHECNPYTSQVPILIYPEEVVNSSGALFKKKVTAYN